MTDALFLILIIIGGVYALLMLALPFIVFGIYNQVWKMRGDLSRFAKAIASQEISVTLEQPTQSIAAPEPPSSVEHKPAYPPLRKR